ncbi:MAG: hypothetical protein NTW50_02530 [Candidatus Berkelbacteria bacterium]|nr:hypothetical protein [Candidatus Berkelbacteria bacterium]
MSLRNVTWLDTLKLMVSDQDSNELLPVPSLELHDHKVGYADPGSRQLFILMYKTKRRLDEKSLQTAHTPQGPEQRRLIAEVDELDHQLKAIEIIFWSNLANRFNLWGKQGMAIKDDGLVVWFDEKKSWRTPLEWFCQLERPQNEDTLIDELIELVAQVDPDEPIMLSEINPEDEGVGFANPGSRQIFILSQRLAVESESLKINAKYTADQTLGRHFVAEATKKERISDALSKVFWVELQNQFNLWGKPSVGVRKNWLVTTCDHLAEGGPGDFIRRMLGL